MIFSERRLDRLIFFFSRTSRSTNRGFIQIVFQGPLNQLNLGVLRKGSLVKVNILKTLVFRNILSRQIQIKDLNTWILKEPCTT